MILVDLADLVGRVVELGGQSDTITKAIDPPPPDITSSKIPCLFGFTDQAQEDDGSEYGEQYVLVTRVIRVQVAVLSTGAGDPSTRESKIRPILNDLTRIYRSYPTLNDLPGIINSRVLGDSGPAILPEYGGKFLGFEIRLQVQYVEEREFSSGE